MLMKMRSSPSPTIHQMCQIRPKPVNVAKKAVMKPIGLLMGMWIGRYVGSGPSRWASIARSLIRQ